MQPFGYDEKPGTCLWCGRRLKFARVWCEAGGNFREAIRDAFRQIREETGELHYGPIKHERLGWIRGGDAYPQHWDGTSEGLVTVGPTGRERRQGEGPPGSHEHDDQFDSNECAAAFGRQLAQLGRKLVRAE